MRFSPIQCLSVLSRLHFDHKLSSGMELWVSVAVARFLFTMKWVMGFNRRYHVFVYSEMGERVKKPAKDNGKLKLKKIKNDVVW